MSAAPPIKRAQAAREASMRVRREYKERDEEITQEIIDEAKREALEALEAQYASTPKPEPEPEPKPEDKPRRPVEGKVWYESREKEPVQFEAAGIRSVRDFSSGRLLWEVAADDVARFEKHFFFTTGRIRRRG